MKKGLFYLKTALFVLLILFGVIGSNCNNLLDPTAGSISGTWMLVKMEGNLQDVCLGENLEFQSSQAVLTCPGANPVTRPYTYTNSVLSYTTAGISYDVTFTSVNGVSKMVLTGKGIERVLTYNKLN
ncbi:hypothetical protein D4R20_02655 [bacterium]|nr:MAG: hypothetical protein D4R20_02655 [bacterium]